MGKLMYTYFLLKMSHRMTVRSLEHPVYARSSTCEVSEPVGRTQRAVHVLVGKGKSKVHPRTGHQGSTLSLTSVLDGVGGQRNAPAA